MALAPEPEGGTPFDAWIAGGLVLSMILIAGLFGFTIGAAL